MARQPIVGSDNNNWGTILDQYLSISLNSDGTLNSSAWNPMIAKGDLIVGGTSGAVGRLPVGTSGQVLTVSGGTATWQSAPSSLGTPLAGPGPSQQTVFGQPDGSIVVLPLSTYSLTGDDAVWINTALGLLPVIPAGGYDGTYNGPWTVGTIKLLPADYTIGSSIVFPNGGTAQLVGHGPGTRLFVQAGVTGIVSRGYGGGWTTDNPAIQTHGLIRDMRIDGTSAGNTGKGISVGGGHGNRIIDVACVNFTGTNAVGLEVANSPSNGQASSWTEKSYFRYTSLNNTTAIHTVQSGANDSMEYNDWHIYMQCGPGQSGLVVDQGVFMSGSQIYMQGNMQNNSVAPLVITGNDGSGGNSAVGDTIIFMSFEHNNTTNNPQTIVFGAAGNKMNNCFGKLRFAFSQSAWAPANPGANQFSFGGVITGDASLIASATTASNAPSGWNVGTT